MKKSFCKKFNWHLFFYLLLDTIALGLIVGGFFCPPMGEIDGSVLTAVGEIFAFALLWKLPEIIKSGKSIKYTKGDMSIEVENGEADSDLSE